MSVVVCAYNEEATLGECLGSLARCRYPNLEVVVCDDGSSDATLAIARRYPFRVLALEHGGLSRSRNAGLAAARGDVIAYLDADAACSPDWLFHLVLSMEDANVEATGGPNLGFADAGFVERAVALSPGSPAEVLIADDRAEHVPGCNMAYRRTSLAQIEGFDEAFTIAGDDVDACWKIIERGHEIAFAPAAQVSHRRRGTIRGYLRQQKGYGRAERMLTGAHPHRFNRLGQARWRGFIYGGARILPSLLRPTVYHGHAGAAPFQPVSRRRAEIATTWLGAFAPFSLPVALIGLVVGVLLSPWGYALSLATLTALVAYGCCVAAAVRPPRPEPHPLALRSMVGLLHVLQPFARTWGRLRGRPLPTTPGSPASWTGDRFTWLRTLEVDLRRRGCGVRIGSASDGWDLVVTTGPLVVGRVSTAVTYGWLPQASLRFAMTRAYVVAAVGSVVLALLVGTWVWAIVVAVQCGAAVEALMLRRRVRAALEVTFAAAT